MDAVTKMMDALEADQTITIRFYDCAKCYPGTYSQTPMYMEDFLKRMRKSPFGQVARFILDHKWDTICSTMELRVNIADATDMESFIHAKLTVVIPLRRDDITHTKEWYWTPQFVKEFLEAVEYFACFNIGKKSINHMNDF
jgi:hypothetical protein